MSHHTITDNATSVRSSSTSAAELAIASANFWDWAQMVKLDLTIQETIPDTAAFWAIRDIQITSKRIPEWMKDQKSANFDGLPSAYHGWKNRLCVGLLSTRYTCYKDEDKSLLFTLDTIFQICEKYSIAHERGTNLELRFGIDTLINRACQADEDSPILYLTNQPLRLPLVTLQDIDLAASTADGIIILDVADFYPYGMNLDLQVAASAIYRCPLNPILELVLCVADYKRVESSESQAKMGMVSALYQKKALNITTQCVFGIFRSGRYSLCVVAGLWENDKITIYTIGTYSLLRPESLLEMFLLVRELKKVGNEYKDQLIKSSPTVQEAVEADPPIDMWAPVRVGLV